MQAAGRQKRAVFHHFTTSKCLFWCECQLSVLTCLPPITLLIPTFPGSLETRNQKLKTTYVLSKRLSLQHLHNSVKILKRRVLNHDLPSSLAIADAHPAAQRPLHLGLYRAHVGILLLINLCRRKSFLR